MTLGHAHGFRVDGVAHRAAQAVAFCERFIGHRGLYFWSDRIFAPCRRLLYLGDLIQTNRFGAQLKRMTLSGGERETIGPHSSAWHGKAFTGLS